MCIITTPSLTLGLRVLVVAVLVAVFFLAAGFCQVVEQLEECRVLAVEVLRIKEQEHELLYRRILEPIARFRVDETHGPRSFALQQHWNSCPRTP